MILLRREVKNTEKKKDTMIIKNRAELLSHGNMKGRKIALDIIDSTMEAIDACCLAKNLIKIEDNILKISNTLTYDLSEIKNIYVLGAGKAVIQIAQALEEILGDRITQGIVVEKKMGTMEKGLERIKKLQRIEVFQGGHPIPDEVGLRGAKKILEISKKAQKRDLVFFCVQGGCTSLTTLPINGIDLEDIQATNDLLLNSGADVKTINTVRAAITQLSRGRLAQYIYPAAIINLVVNDYVWNYPITSEDGYTWGWGPTVPILGYHDIDDANTIIHNLKKSSLWNDIPYSVKNRLLHFNPLLGSMTVTDYENMGINYHTFILANPETSACAAKTAAEKMLGLNSMILSTTLEGEAKEVGIMLAGIAKEIAKNGRPLKVPCVVITSGEKTVTIPNKHGSGGRNQEIVLSAVLKIQESNNIVIASIGTDGTDGPTSIAGGIVDGYTLHRTMEKNIDISQCLHDHDSSYALIKLGDAIFFNEPGNNVCDLSLIVVTD